MRDLEEGFTALDATCADAGPPVIDFAANFQEATIFPTNRSSPKPAAAIANTSALVKTSSWPSPPAAIETIIAL
jgi:hypothetical protein